MLSAAEQGAGADGAPSLAGLGTPPRSTPASRWAGGPVLLGPRRKNLVDPPCLDEAWTRDVSGAVYRRARPQMSATARHHERACLRTRYAPSIPPRLGGLGSCAAGSYSRSGK